MPLRAESSRHQGKLSLKRSITNIRGRLHKASMPNLHKVSTPAAQRQDEIPTVPRIPDTYARQISPPVIFEPVAPAQMPSTPEKSSHYLRKREVSQGVDESSKWSATTFLRSLAGGSPKYASRGSSSSLSSAASSTSPLNTPMNSPHAVCTMYSKKMDIPLPLDEPVPLLLPAAVDLNRELPPTPSTTIRSSNAANDLSLPRSSHIPGNSPSFTQYCGTKQPNAPPQRRLRRVPPPSLPINQLRTSPA